MGRSSYRDSSPTSRSERRLSPRRPSPTRSERGYRDRREYQDYRDRDRDNRYYSSNGRDTSPDRYSDRSHRSDRGSSSRYSPREDRDPSCSWWTSGSPENQHTRSQNIITHGTTTRKQKLWCTCLVFESCKGMGHLGGNPVNILKSCSYVNTSAG